VRRRGGEAGILRRGARWPATWHPLVDAAREALRHARGKPRWAAAIEDEHGRIHAGASISLPDLPAASLCAEHVAVAALVSAGSRNSARVVVVARGPAGAAPPCGRCLQVLCEMGADPEIRWGTCASERGRSTLARLLPSAFRDYPRPGARAR